jgi:uncharacterized protein (TIRG00374 family)
MSPPVKVRPSWALQGFYLGKFRLLLSAFVSLGLLALTIRNLEWPELVAASRAANYSLILLAAAVMIGAHGLRALRWSYLLRPVRSLNAGTLFPVVLIGFFANYVLPARTGELVRAYVLGKREHLSKSTILGSIAVEKATDVLVLFVILFGTLELVPLPGWISDFERGTAIILIAVVLGMFLLAARGRWAASRIVRGLHFLFPWWKERLARVTYSFVDGLGVVYHGSSLGAVILLSAGIWLMTFAIFAIIGSAMGLDLPLYGYVIIVAITNVASLVPSMPGRLGTLEFLSVTVLGLFGVASSTALLFPVLLRMAQVVPLLLGYFFWNREGVRLLDTQNIANETPPATEGV